MANKVVLDQSEINMFTENLLYYHKDIIAGITKVQTQIRLLNTDGDIFTMDKTVRKVNALLDTIDGDILPLLKNTLGESNKCTELLVQIMNGLDS